MKVVSGPEFEATGPPRCCDRVVGEVIVMGGPEFEGVALLVSLFTLLLFLIVPTALPSTVPMMMRTTTAMAMMPLRLRQKDVWEVVAAGVDAAEPSFSPEPASVVAGAKGIGTVWGQIVFGGNALCTEGVCQGGWSRRLTS